MPISTFFFLTFVGGFITFQLVTHIVPAGQPRNMTYLAVALVALFLLTHRVSRADQAASQDLSFSSAPHMLPYGLETGLE